MAEMVTQYPVAGGFIRLAGHFVGESFGFMAGWNYFLYEALVIPFEISALAIVVQYWNEDAPIWAICLGCIVLYGLINCLVVNAYGEAEFWLAGGKVILVFALFAFTLISMLGGNPKHDRYGFRYWSNPGAFAVSCLCHQPLFTSNGSLRNSALPVPLVDGRAFSQRYGQRLSVSWDQSISP